MKNARTALAFLTRLPGGRHPDDGEELTAAVPWFGLIGLVVGALGASVFWLVHQLEVGPTLPAVAAITVTALATGGFHEDGLADSFDALAGGWTVEDRLRILKDSRHGTFGVLAIVLAAIWKVGALQSLGAEQGAEEGAVALLVAHSLGRSMAVFVMGTFPSARQVGLGADYTRDLRPVPTAVGAVVGMLVAIGAYRLDAWMVIVPAVVGAAIVGWWALRKIGGVSGDLLGAAEQVAEILVLSGAAVLVSR